MLHLAQAALPEPPELLVQPLLPVACSDKAAAVVVEAQQALVALVVQAVVALVVAVAVLAAAHTQQVLAGLVALAGHWYWSFDHAALCSC